MQKDNFTENEIMLLLQSDAENATVISTMMAIVKKDYVKKTHPYAITTIAKGKKAGKFKTYVGNPRKEVIRNTETELIEFLYNYYFVLNEKLNTFGSVLDAMLSELINDNNRSLHTVASYKSDLKIIFTEAFFQRPITEISESELKSTIVNQTKALHPKPERLRKAIQSLNRVFIYAICNHICTCNPAQYIDAKKYLSNCDTSKKKAEEKEFSENQLTAIAEDMMKTSENPRALMALLALETGMRRDELCALRWEDVENEYIHIHRQQLTDPSASPKRAYEVLYTKDEREHPHDGRYFPITAKIQNILDLAKKLKGKSEYIFHDGDSWILKDGYTHFLTRRCKALGISTTNNHAFRISLNNRLIQEGYSPDDRALLLGHSVEVNERYYSKSDRRRLERIKEKMV